MNQSVLVESWEKQAIEQIPNGWSNDDYQALLDLLEVGETPANERRDYVLLALADLERREATTVVLTYLLSDHLSEGQIQNLANELEEEKLWEEYADIALHSAFFLAVELLYEAFNGGFPIPKAQLIQATLRPISPTTAEDIKELSSAAIIRLLAAGFDDGALMRRLFEDQLKGEAFPDAEGIIWHKSIRMITPDTFEMTIISSEYWLEDFAAPESFKAVFVVEEEEEEEV